VADAAMLPQVNAQLDATRQRYTATGAVPAPLAGSIRESGTLQLSGGWELDFFGKNRAALEAALGVARAAQAEADAARVMLSAHVVRAYLHLARVQGLLQVAGRTLAQREEALRLVHDRVTAGLDSHLELRQAESAVPDARAQLEALREQAQLARHAIAALVGQPLSDPAPEAPSLAALRPLPAPAAVPADLLGRRADIAAARWRVEAAGLEVDQARAQFYPNVNLVAFAGNASIGLDRLLDAGSRQWGVGPAIRLPVFEGGRLRANLRARAADREAAVASYDSAVLEAVREVADQLATAQSIARQQAQQHQAHESAEAAWGIALQRYRAGLGNYLQVLSAETAVLAQRRQAVDLAARTLDTQAALARALGGGWAPASPAATAAASDNRASRSR
jgi:NodT family efflux transporter outer membrane factor (OMF) lipoprotein